MSPTKPAIDAPIKGSAQPRPEYPESGLEGSTTEAAAAPASEVEQDTSASESESMSVEASADAKPTNKIDEFAQPSQVEPPLDPAEAPVPPSSTCEEVEQGTTGSKPMAVGSSAPSETTDSKSTGESSEPTFEDDDLYIHEVFHDDCN